MENLHPMLEITGLVIIITIGILITILIGLGSTIAELRGRVMSLEETMDSKNKEIRHKKTYIEEIQVKLQRLEKYHAMYQAPAPEIKAYKSVKLQAETGRDASENICKFYIREEIIKNIDDFIEYEKLDKNKYRGTLIVYKKDE